MEVLVQSQILAKSLNLLSKAISKNSAMPILGCFLFDVEEAKVKITATDLDVTYTMEMECQSKEKGRFAISAEILIDIIKVLPDQVVKLIFSNKQLDIETMSGSYKMAVDDGKLFPKSIQMTESKSLVIPAHILNTALSKTVYSIGTDELKPMLNGVCFDMRSDKLIFVSTDANRLVKYIHTGLGVDEETQFILPKKPISVLRNSLTGLDAEVEIEYNSVNVTFTFLNHKISCRLIDAKYPNYEAVIPKENPNTLVINRMDFLSSLNRISIFASKITHQVVLDKKGNQLVVSSEDIDFNNKAVETLQCVGEGEDLRIGFNSRFLSEMLSNLTSEKVKMSMSVPNRGGILQPESGLAEGEEITMLVMPVMIKN